MDSKVSKRLGASLALVVSGGVLSLVAIVSRPNETSAAGGQPQSVPHPDSAAPRSLMIDERPVLGELQDQTERTVILGGEGVSYLDVHPDGTLWHSPDDVSSMLADRARPMRLMLVDLPDPW